MSYIKRTRSSRKRLHMTVKVAALIAALGLVTIMLERPQLTASPHRSTVSMEQESLGAVDRVARPAGDSASEPEASDESALPAAAATHAPSYFPGQFPLPDGRIDPQPVGF
jgi:hypothetical protein